MKPDIFYVYEHWRPDKGVCFYVGKGKGKRAFSLRYRDKYHKHICNKLISAGLAVDIRFVAADLSESAAFALEKERIAFWREHGVKLANRTDGGEGPSGFEQSEEHREKRLSARMAYLRTPEGRASQERLLAAAIAANTGRSLSVETRLKMSKTRKAKPLGATQLAIGKIGRNKTRQHIEAIRIAKAKARARRLAGDACADLFA